MKSHVRYGTHCGGGGGGGGRGGGGAPEKGIAGINGGSTQQEAMIEEYKLEEQLFYETSSDPATSRRFLAASATKPTLRTVSIMETLSELTNGNAADHHGNYDNHPTVSNNGKRWRQSRPHTLVQQPILLTNFGCGTALPFKASSRVTQPIDSNQFGC